MSVPLNTEPADFDESIGTSPANVIRARADSADVIRASIQDVLQQWVIRSSQCLKLIMCLFLLGFCIILYWSQLVYDRHRDDYCDQPLALMLRILLVVVAAMVLWKEISKYLCCYDLHRDGHEPPLRVRLLIRLARLSVLAWPVTACYLLSSSNSCSSELKLAIKVVLGYYASLAVFVLVVPTVAAAVIFCLMRRGMRVMPRMPGAAPEGLLDRLAVVEFDPSKFNDGSEPDSLPSSCAVCLEAFNSEKTIVKTPCNHVMHKDCIGGWFDLARTCPLCRQDIAECVEQGQA